jgi:membrane-bound serine protease (ClpP class)
VPHIGFADKVADPLPNTILTPVKRAILLVFLAAAAVAGPVAAGGAFAAGGDSPRVLAVHFDNDVNPVTADYLTGQIDRANDKGYDAVVIVMDTPGGLSDSMRKVYQRELASKVPVIVYVAPDGARAASAGVWIGEAADVLAMAPQTNIGSSTPISVGGEDIQKDLRRKVVNDAAASLRALAKSHGRNVEWADAAVRKASNLTADEALKANVIDAVAPTLPALLKQLEGYKTVPKGDELELAGAQIDDVHMSLWKRILDALIDPNIITILLSLGTLGLIVEMWNPGLIFPGTVGAVCLVLGLFGLSVLPVSAAGILMLLLAALFFVLETFIPSHGALTLAAVLAFLLGTLLLFDPAGSAYQVSLPLAVGIAATMGAFMLLVVAKLIQIRRRPVEVGVHSLVGEHGVVRGDGLVFVNGELWHAHRADGGALELGEDVSVERVVEDGLELIVAPARVTEDARA